MVGRKNNARGSCCATVSMNTIIHVNTKGDHVTSVGPAKIRQNVMNSVSACLYNNVPVTLFTTDKEQNTHCLDIKNESKIMTLLSHIGMIPLDKKQQKFFFVFSSECVTISADVDTAVCCVLTYRITGYTNIWVGRGGGQWATLMHRDCSYPLHVSLVS